MHLFLTGANGYIGTRILPTLLEEGHKITALVRSIHRFPTQQFEPFLKQGQLVLLEGDLLGNLPDPPPHTHAAYYLVHSMGSGADFAEKEAECARRFISWIKSDRVIYLSGLVPQAPLSPHLASRESVNEILHDGPIPVTTLRASIIVGSGSASFEIIRDLAEKLPFMITPRWTANRCQPIAIRNVITYLTDILKHPETLNQSYDIGGPEVLTYRQLLLGYATARGLKRFIIPVPFFTPRLSARWLYFVTATSYPLAKSLVDSLVNETICQDHRLAELIPQSLLTYHEAIEAAFIRIAQNKVPSSWFDSLASGNLPPSFFQSIQVPSHGVLTDQQAVPLAAPREKVIAAVWSLGGTNGWPSLNWAWHLRGWIDRLVGGTGIRRGRRHPSELKPGDALDFWRVLLADRSPDGQTARLILTAEMKLPGEAWLEFEVSDETLTQTATFRPLGLLGRAYWYAILPLHWLLFPRMAKKLAAAKSR